MGSSYAYTFHYDNGRRAVEGMYGCSLNEAVDYACELSVLKKRLIKVREHTPNWYNDSNTEVAYCKNGKVIYGVWGVKR